MQFESLNAELEHNQELANSRMTELEKLQLELQEAVRESEKLRVKLAKKMSQFWGKYSLCNLWLNCLFILRWIYGIFQKML